MQSGGDTRPVPLAAALVPAVEERLLGAGCVAADEEAVELVAAAPDEPTLERWIRRREQGEPLAWITGVHVFCDLRLHVASGVYVPRHQTEELARWAAAALPAGGRAVDLCTGTGAVAAHLRHRVPSARVVGVDLDPRAAACARRNGVPAVAGDLDRPLRLDRSVDVVTAVAPYVPTGEIGVLPADVQRYEPRRALDGGADGLEVVRGVVAAASRLLRPGGALFVEVGGDQDDQLVPLLASSGFGDVVARRDEEGDLRGIAARVAEDTAERG